MKKFPVFFFGIIAISIVVLTVFLYSKTTRVLPPGPIVVSESDRSTPANLLDKKQDRNYVTTLSSFPKVLQIQGVISNIKSDSFTIWSQKNYQVITNDKSVFECRDKFIRLPDGSLALAYSIYLDLSRYVATIQANKESYVRQGKLLLYKDAYSRIESNSWVTGVFQEQEGKEKKYLLDTLLVYGCK